MTTGMMKGIGYGMTDGSSPHIVSISLWPHYIASVILALGNKRTTRIFNHIILMRLYGVISSRTRDFVL